MLFGVYAFHIRKNIQHRPRKIGGVAWYDMLVFRYAEIFHQKVGALAIQAYPGNYEIHSVVGRVEVLRSGFAGVNYAVFSRVRVVFFAVERKMHYALVYVMYYIIVPRRRSVIIVLRPGNVPARQKVHGQVVVIIKVVKKL